jgi:hypothetical protein
MHFLWIKLGIEKWPESTIVIFYVISFIDQGGPGIGFRSPKKYCASHIFSVTPTELPTITSEKF